MLVLSFILIAPYIQPPWILSIMVVLSSIVMYLIPRTKLLAVALVPIAILFGLSILPLFVFSCTLAILVMGEVIFHESGDRMLHYIIQIVSGLGACVLVMFYLDTWEPLVVIFGIVVAVLLKAILCGREDALMIEALGVAMTMFLIHELNYSVDLALIAFAVIVAFSFGFFSFRTGTADVSGLFSGALIGIVLIVFADIRVVYRDARLLYPRVSQHPVQWEYKQQMGIEQAKGAQGILERLCKWECVGSFRRPLGCERVTRFPGTLCRERGDCSCGHGSERDRCDGWGPLPHHDIREGQTWDQRRHINQG